MKNKRAGLVILAVFLLVPFVITDAGVAKWQLYDDFEGGEKENGSQEKRQKG